MNRAAKKKSRRASKRKAARHKTRSAQPAFQGWRTSDADEIARRELRGADAATRIEGLDPRRGVFGDFRVSSASGEAYLVELRSVAEHINSCACNDYQVNRLGTCKHIEAVRRRLESRGKRKFADAAKKGSDRVEIYLDRRDARVHIRWPDRSRGRSATRDQLSKFFSRDGSLLADPVTAVAAVRRAVAKLPAAARGKIRISAHLAPWVEEQRQLGQRESARAAFEADLAAGKRSLDIVDAELYPYQREGVLHLAFTERALLADEMGLGKTVQAIAACELLRRLRGIERVLVVSPASLKTEWEEQNAKFTSLPAIIVQGTRAKRLAQYRMPSFFYFANYEQVRLDVADIGELLSPDVVILDEAQRIKNWQTQTATQIKRLSSRYAFVLTGTPLENRIDEIYSIVQFLDPSVFGPLFRFNRDFYDLDERGRAQGYKNLDELHRRLRPIMLRRRKEEVESELPGRTVNTFFVEMDPEQVSRYADYELYVGRLLAAAKRRPLTKKEFELLQQWLACMRMLCDTPYILDDECRVAPKIDELETILDDLLEQDSNHKVIIFSEWERMLMLARERSAHIDSAWHTGSVPQAKRRGEIRRFKDDPDCRLFFSTDAGSVGLNLQAADVVINLDLPWNPAKLEQRIARAWRKHQTRPVQVVNLVSEGTIEHRMLHILEQKRTLAESVVDGSPKVKEMALPSGRAAFIARLEGLMGGMPATPRREAPAPAADPSEHLRDDLTSQLSDRLDLLEVHEPRPGLHTVFAVLDHADQSTTTTITNAASEHFGKESPRVEVLDRATFEVIQRLIDSGVLSADPASKVLHRSATLGAGARKERHTRLAEARQEFDKANRQRRMADVLVSGEFVQEAVAPMKEAVEIGLRALAHALGEDSNGAAVPLDMVRSRLVSEGALPADTVACVSTLREAQPLADEAEAQGLIRTGARIVESVQRRLQA